VSWQILYGFSMNGKNKACRPVWLFKKAYQKNQAYSKISPYKFKEFFVQCRRNFQVLSAPQKNHAPRKNFKLKF